MKKLLFIGLSILLSGNASAQQKKTKGPTVRHLAEY